jgi:hypothetical protein
LVEAVKHFLLQGWADSFENETFVKMGVVGLEKEEDEVMDFWVVRRELYEHNEG